MTDQVQLGVPLDDLLQLDAAWVEVVRGQLVELSTDDMGIEHTSVTDVTHIVKNSDKVADNACPVRKSRVTARDAEVFDNST